MNGPATMPVRWRSRRRVGPTPSPSRVMNLMVTRLMAACLMWHVLLTSVCNAQQPIRLSLVAWQDDGDAELRKCAGILSEFSRRHPQFQVDMTYDSWANAYGRLSRWCGSLNEYAPDMTIIPDQWMGEFSDHLYAFGPGFTQHLQAFFPPVLAPAIIDGRTHGVPWRMDSQVLYYRTDLLAEAGQNPPQTWEQLSAAATEVANPSEGIYGFGLPGAVSGGGANLLLTLLWSSGGEVVDGDGEIRLVSEQMIVALDYCVQLARSGVLQPEVLAWDQASLQQAFMDGKLTMLIADSTLATRLHQSKSHPDYAVSPLPAGDHPLAFVSMSYLVVMRTSHHREACQEFLKYMASKDVQERMLQTGTIPSHWEVAERFRREPPMSAFVANLEHAHSRPNRNWELLQAGLDDALFLAISGRMSATEALELVQAKYFSATPEVE